MLYLMMVGESQIAAWPKGSKLDHFGALECSPPRRNSIPVR